MDKIREDTVGGFNHFVKEQKDAPSEAWLTLTSAISFMIGNLFTQSLS